MTLRIRLNLPAKIGEVIAYLVYRSVFDLVGKGYRIFRLRRFQHPRQGHISIPGDNRYVGPELHNRPPMNRLAYPVLSNDRPRGSVPRIRARVDNYLTARQENTKHVIRPRPAVYAPRLHSNNRAAFGPNH